MIDSFLFIALPYLAIFLCVGGSIYRARAQPLSYSALSSQFLEGKNLIWGSLPWHIGIILILMGHLLALFCPGLWQAVISSPAILLAIETLGIGLGASCLLGLIVLLVRRLTSAKVQAVTSPMDLVVLLLLLVQVALGVGVACSYKWGAAWCTGTMTPYVWSILTFHPNISYISDLPIIAKAHIVGGWLFILIVPFSRLIHMFALPIHYLFRPPINVVWSNPRYFDRRRETEEESAARRYFMQGIVGVVAGGLLLSIGTLDKIFRFFFGPRLTDQQESELMATRLERLESTAEERSLELQRRQSNYIFVAAFSELSSSSGKYFIDYEMRPALAFKGTDGLPNFLSAKCTHLGCTVGNEVNEQGQILCPCHISYFNVESGKPNAGAPAKDPLPHLPWVIMDNKGKVLTSRSTNGTTVGDTNPNNLADAKVYIVKDGGATT